MIQMHHTQAEPLNKCFNIFVSVYVDTLISTLYFVQDHCRRRQWASCRTVLPTKMNNSAAKTDVYNPCIPSKRGWLQFNVSYFHSGTERLSHFGRDGSWGSRRLLKNAIYFPLVLLINQPPKEQSYLLNIGLISFLSALIQMLMLDHPLLGFELEYTGWMFIQLLQLISDVPL